MSSLPKPTVLALVLLGTSACRFDPRIEARELEPISLVAALPAPSLLPKGATHYEFVARLDAARHEIGGKGRISWTNRSDVPIGELYLHLYLNAFRKGSLFLRGSGGRSGGLVGREGRIEILRLTSPLFESQDLWAHAERHSPQDPADQTDIRVPLPRPVLPGELLELDVEFVSVLPEIVERTGYAGDYHLLAQWFPKIARLETDGRWAHFPFHAFAEFYSDFDDYDILLDVPKTHRVGAVGRLTSESSADPGRARYRVRAESVVDFAWMSAPNSSQETRKLGPTLVHLFTSEDEPLARRAHWETLDAGLSELGRWLGAYPYPELTVVVPPRGAERSGGMEYPSFITTGGGETSARLGIREVELLVIHELAHQWFQSLVASNESEYPFLDEGLASYAEWRFLQSRYGSASLAAVMGLRLSRNAGGRFAALYDRGAPVTINQPARDFPSFQSLAREVYGRTPLVLETLARTFGRRTVDSAVAAYARRQRGQHPTPGDFYDTLAVYLGPERRPLIAELFDQPRRYNLRLDALDTIAAPSGDEFESTVTISRDGGPGLPYQLLVRLKGGGRLHLEADGEQERETITFRHRDPVVSLLLDPEERLLLDENPEDDRLLDNGDRLPDVDPTGFLAALTSSVELISFGLSP